MSSLEIPYQHIADILSFETSNIKLKKDLNHPSFDWDSIVVEGSKHLMLPALYCRLKTKGLLGCLPKDLQSYLEEITRINRERNHAILEQVHTISKLFNAHGINHIFLKGSALLAANCFHDHAERMIGDIDILVALDQLDVAFKLLQNEGYLAKEETLGNTFFEHKHLPRLTVSRAIGAVELHRKLFVSYVHPQLTNPKLLKNKIKCNNIYIPSQDHLLMHNILNYQVNDHGARHNSISFRSAYDSIALLRKYNYRITWNTNHYFQNYFNITGLFFNDIALQVKNEQNHNTAFYLFKLKHIGFYKLWDKLLNITSTSGILLKRLAFFLKNKPYRKAIINDKNRIVNHLKHMMRKI